MGYYFKLKYLRNLRRIKDFGIHPLLAISIVSVLFIGTSLYVFTLEYHQYIYTTLAVICGYSINRTRSKSMIKNVFSQKQYQFIRVTESVFLALPFILFLLVYHYFTLAILLVIAAVSNSLIGPSNKFNFTLPTPFSCHPFEFSIGFRKSFLVFVIHAFLMYKAVEAHNANLGLFSLALVFFIACSFYFQPEGRFFVWIFAKTPIQFLRYKIATAIRYYLFLILPSAVILFLFFPANLAALFGLCAASLFYLVAVILAKYAAFPNEIQLPQLIFLGLSLLIPPFLIIAIYQFYKQSIHNLNSILAHDKH